MRAHARVGRALPARVHVCRSWALLAEGGDVLRLVGGPLGLRQPRGAASRVGGVRAAEVPGSRDAGLDPFFGAVSLAHGVRAKETSSSL